MYKYISKLIFFFHTHKQSIIFCKTHVMKDLAFFKGMNIRPAFKTTGIHVMLRNADVVPVLVKPWA